MVRAGAKGWYPEMFCPEDGYDVIVRRHLALGGEVYFPANEEVMGELVEYHDKKNPDGPVDCAGDPDEYAGQLIELMRLM